MSGGDVEPRKTVLVTMPGHFCVRNIVYTPVVEEMASRTEVRWVLCGLAPADRQAVESLGHPNIVYEPLRHRLDEKPLLQLAQRLLRRFDERYLYPALVYRFLASHKLRALTTRLAMSRDQRRLEQVYSNFAPRWIGEPAPANPALYSLLRALRHANTPLHRSAWAERLFETYHPDALLHARVQTPFALAFTNAASRRRVPIIGVFQSWDQPTTKGFLPPGVDRFIAGSMRMASQAHTVLGVPRESIDVIGHTHLDAVRHDRGFDTGEIKAKLGFDARHRLLLFGTNAMTLRSHEIPIAARLARAIDAGEFGDDVRLVIRTHPQDIRAEQDFGPLRSDRVRVVHASSFGHYAPRAEAPPREDIRGFWRMLRAASVVINTRSSLTLDAIAVETPVINLGYEPDPPRVDADAVRHRYTLEFFEPLVRCGATPVVRSEDELFDAIRAYLADPSLHAGARRIAREEHLEPFDGGASRRLVDRVCEAAGLNPASHAQPITLPAETMRSAPALMAG